MNTLKANQIDLMLHRLAIIKGHANFIPTLAPAMGKVCGNINENIKEIESILLRASLVDVAIEAGREVEAV